MLVLKIEFHTIRFGKWNFLLNRRKPDMLFLEIQSGRNRDVNGGTCFNDACFFRFPCAEKTGEVQPTILIVQCTVVYPANNNILFRGRNGTTFWHHTASYLAFNCG